MVLNPHYTVNPGGDRVKTALSRNLDMAEEGTPNVCPINGSATLWKLPPLEESIYNDFNVLSLWHSYVTWSKNSYNCIADLMDNATHSGKANAKQVTNGSVFNIGTQSPQSDSNLLVYWNGTMQEMLLTQKRLQFAN